MKATAPRVALLAALLAAACVLTGAWTHVDSDGADGLKGLEDLEGLEGLEGMDGTDSMKPDDFDSIGDSMDLGDLGLDGEDEHDDVDDGDDGADSDAPAVLDPPGQEGASGYEAPAAPESAVFVETFQDGLGKWIHSSVDQYTGRFAVGQGKDPALPGDRGLIIPNKARHYALSTPVSIASPSENDFVLQYELKLEEGMTCGGAYMKLPTAGFAGGESFDSAARYSIMFGPDHCGSTDKVHFIFQSHNPVTGEYTEHHLTNPPSIASIFDKKTHLYTLAVRANGSVTVSVDGKVKREGTLSEDFEPPVEPVEEIDDPEDSKPEDWVEEKKIPDPNAEKPEDWDEDAPKEIPDMSVEMPEGWLVDEPLQVRDPDAEKPESWDDENDGEWRAPMIPNPKCEDVGCGEWQRPTMKNPDYKGKWKAPMIDNPEYRGAWAPRKIPNPAYYKVEKLGLLPIHALGFEIWTMDQGVLFDNIYVGTDVDDAAAFADATYGKKSEVEDAAAEAKRKADAEAKKEEDTTADKALEQLEMALSWLESALAPLEEYLVKIGAEPMLDQLIDLGIKRPLVVSAAVPLVVVFFLAIAMAGGRKKSKTVSTKDATAEQKKTDAIQPDDPSVKNASEDASQTTAATDDVSAAEPTVRRRKATAE